MRITIDIDEQHAASKTLVVANGQATDAGGPPAALLQTLAAHTPALASQPKAGNDGGPPPQHLLQALLNPSSPRANGANAEDGGAARG